MNSKIKKLPGSQVELEVVLTDQEFQPYWQPAYDAALAQVEIKGFRRGAAPKEMADAAVDKEKVFQAALKDAVRGSLDSEKEKNKWTFIDAPKVELLESAVGVKYKATLTLFPEIELGNYKKISAKVFSGKKEVKVEDKDVADTLEWLRKSRAAVTLVERGAALGDLIDADIETRVDGKELPNAQFKGDRFVIGESHFIKGFDEQLINKKAKDVVTFSLTAPENYWEAALRGKQFEFSVKVNGVYERKLPDLTDEFAKGLGSKFSTVDDVKKSITEGLTQEKQEKEVERLRALALEEIVKASKFDLPQIMIEKTLDGLVAETMQMVSPQANQKPEALAAELREKLVPRAKQNVGGHLVLYKIAETEKLNPSDEEIEAEAKGAQVDLEQYYDYIYGRLQNQKVFKFLEEAAKENK